MIVISCEIDGTYRELLTHIVKKGGLAVRNSAETAEMALATSKATTQHFVNLLVKYGVPFDPNEHERATLLANVGARKDRLT